MDLWTKIKWAMETNTAVALVEGGPLVVVDGVKSRFPQRGWIVGGLTLDGDEITYRIGKTKVLEVL